jgi:glucosamine--fructose-6-phosphate aminotransferase (isomerizing)
VGQLLEKLPESGFPDPFLAEIHAQPEAMRRAARGLRDQLPALGRLPTSGADRRLIFTGMGGSYATCYAPVTRLASAAITSIMVDSAELLYFRRPTLSGPTVLVVVSQSGESAEVVRLMEELSSNGDCPTVVSVSNGLRNSLAKAATIPLDTCAGPEQGPSTKTFAAALVLLKAVADVLRGEPPQSVVERLPEEADTAAGSVEQVLAAVDERAEGLRSWLGDRPILTLLGRGSARAAAEMGALTLKEAARFPAEAMESAQFRHGPLELAGRDAAVIMITIEAPAQEVDARLAAQLVNSGVAVLRIACMHAAMPGARAIDLGHVDPTLAAAAAIVPIQLLAWRLAVDRGLKPGTYIRASKITSHE